MLTHPKRNKLPRPRSSRSPSRCSRLKKSRRSNRFNSECFLHKKTKRMSISKRFHLLSSHRILQEKWNKLHSTCIPQGKESSRFLSPCTPLSSTKSHQEPSVALTSLALSLMSNQRSMKILRKRQMISSTLIMLEPRKMLSFTIEPLFKPCFWKTWRSPGDILTKFKLELVSKWMQSRSNVTLKIPLLRRFTLSELAAKLVSR